MVEFVRNKTTLYYIPGKFMWCRAEKPNKFGKWSTVQYPSKEGMEIVRKLKEEGLKNVVKKDEDGENITWSRDTQKMIKGKLIAFTAPIVLGADGQTPLKDYVGNGSDGVIKIAVYSYNHPIGGKGIAARWESIRIDNLVPYNKDRDFQDDQLKQVAGLDQQPAQPF